LILDIDCVNVNILIIYQFPCIQDFIVFITCYSCYLLSHF